MVFLKMIAWITITAWGFASSEAKGVLNVQEKGYGSWSSPIGEEELVAGQVNFAHPSFDGSTLYWLESRPREGGRTVICRRQPGGPIEEVLPQPFNARSTVHEYGGGSYLVHKGRVFFSNARDQRIYQFSQEKPQPEPLTPTGPFRFANYIMDETRQRLIGVREHHQGSGQPVNELVGVSLAEGSVQVLATGADFYAKPSLNPSGTELAWLSWQHPNMPWDHTQLWRARLDEQGQLNNRTQVAGQKDESVGQPEWSADGRLYFVSDRSEWWNLYVHDGQQITAYHPMTAEFSAPMWSLSMSYYGLASENRVIALYSANGLWQMGSIEPEHKRLLPLKLPYTSLSSLTVRQDEAVCIAASPTKSAELIRVDLTKGSVEVIRSGQEKESDPSVTSIPESIKFATAEGQVAYGLYYPPFNAAFRAPVGAVPPLITMVHGGPTSSCDSAYAIEIQYWTSRGFAVFNLNHRGSSGYGRTFRNQLRGKWGVADLEDAKAGALHLVASGKANRDQLIIRGGSAGGYTTLAALAFHDVFRAGCSYYGISDLATLAEETHKFESRYMERLIGPWPADEATYRARSPLFHLEKIDRPVLLLQGSEDKVVPPNQSELIFEALKKRGVPVAYLSFQGEAHGFRKAESIMRAYLAERYFYAKVFGFESEGLPPIDIVNL